MEEILTASQVASLLQIHPRTVYKLAGRGLIPGRKDGAAWRFKRDEILKASAGAINNGNGNGQAAAVDAATGHAAPKKSVEEAKSKFISHVSHELRIPLLAIEQSLSLLLGQELGAVNAAQEKFLNIAFQNINRLSRLVNDLLDVAKLEAGRMELNPIVFEVGKMLHHVVETVQSWAANKALTIEERYPDRDLIIEDRLIQVVTNLLGNAVKFTPEGGTISLELDPEWIDPAISPEPCIAVSVQDSGIGIPQEDQQRIFEKFEQVSLSSPEGVSSTGLGLTIAKEIVELHGGKIWVESREGEGSKFTFAIPKRLTGRAEVEPASESQDA